MTVQLVGSPSTLPSIKGGRDSVTLSDPLLFLWVSIVNFVTVVSFVFRMCGCKVEGEWGGGIINHLLSFTHWLAFGIPPPSSPSLRLPPIIPPADIRNSGQPNKIVSSFWSWEEKKSFIDRFISCKKIFLDIRRNFLEALEWGKNDTIWRYSKISIWKKIFLIIECLFHVTFSVLISC